MKKIKDFTKKEKQERERVKIFVAGAESAMYMIGKDLSGASLRMFDLHSYGLLSILRQLKKTYRIKSKKEMQSLYEIRK